MARPAEIVAAGVAGEGASLAHLIRRAPPSSRPAFAMR